jgi:hypothetical protein
VKSGTRNPHIIPLNIYGFRENRTGEDSTFVMDVSHRQQIYVKTVLHAATKCYLVTSVQTTTSRNAPQTTRLEHGKDVVVAYFKQLFQYVRLKSGGNDTLQRVKRNSVKETCFLFV